MNPNSEGEEERRANGGFSIDLIGNKVTTLGIVSENEKFKFKSLPLAQSCYFRLIFIY
jgi:hypothetical protein